MAIIDVIKCEMDNQTFIQKHEAEDFSNNSVLIVRESQEALLFMNGKAADLFGPGKHVLHTDNIPILRKILNIPTGGVSKFQCEVYFINKTEQMAINWGMGGVNYLDPTCGDYPFVIGANGEMSIKITDSRKIITKLVGTEHIFDQTTLIKYFKSIIVTYLKTLLPKILKEKQVSIFQVEDYLIEVADELKIRILAEMQEYGISLEKLWVNDILKPESDSTYIMMRRQRGELATLGTQGTIEIQRAQQMGQVDLVTHSIEIQKQQMNVNLRAYELEQLHTTHKEERQFDVMEKMAENPGAGADVRNMFIGGMTGSALMQPMGGAISNIAQTTMNGIPGVPEAPAVPNMQMPGGMPTGMPGGIPGQIQLKEEVTPVQKSEQDSEMDIFKKKIEKLTMMKEAGLLSEEEFIAQRNALMMDI